jgi:hypothetical protein
MKEAPWLFLSLVKGNGEFVGLDLNVHPFSFFKPHFLQPSSLQRSDLLVEKKEPFPHRVDCAVVRKRNVHDTESNRRVSRFSVR